MRSLSRKDRKQYRREMFRLHGYCYAQAESNVVNGKLSRWQIQVFKELHEKYSCLYREYYSKATDPAEIPDLSEQTLFNFQQFGKFKHLKKRLKNILYPPVYKKCYIPELMGYLTNNKWMKFMSNRLSGVPEYWEFEIPECKPEWRK